MGAHIKLVKVRQNTILWQKVRADDVNSSKLGHAISQKSKFFTFTITPTLQNPKIYDRVLALTGSWSDGFLEWRDGFYSDWNSKFSITPLHFGAESAFTPLQWSAITPNGAMECSSMASFRVRDRALRRKQDGCYSKLLRELE